MTISRIKNFRPGLSHVLVAIFSFLGQPIVAKFYDRYFSNPQESYSASPEKIVELLERKDLEEGQRWFLIGHAYLAAGSCLNAYEFFLRSELENGPSSAWQSEFMAKACIPVSQRDELQPIVNFYNERKTVKFREKARADSIRMSRQLAQQRKFIDQQEQALKAEAANPISGEKITFHGL